MSSSARGDQLERLPRQALPRRHQRRPARGAALPVRRLRVVLGRRVATRLQPRLPRVPHLEALPRRHGRRPVAVRLRLEKDDGPDEQPGAGHHPDVEGQHDLLRLGSRRALPDEPVQLRPDDEADEEAHRLHRLRHQVPVARRRRHRVRERRLHLPVRPRDPEGGEGAGHHRRGSRQRAAGPRRREQDGDRLRDRARRQPGALRRARRRLHRAGQERPHAEPDADLRRARARLEVVARRPLDLLRLRPDRRGRDSDRAAGRPGRGRAGHEEQRQLQVPARLVARQQEAALVGPHAAPALRGRRHEGRDRGGRGDLLGDHRLRVVARQPVDRLRQAGGAGRRPDLPLLARLEGEDPGHRRLVRRLRPGVQPGRHAALLRVGALVPADLRGERVRDRLHRHVEDLLRHAGEGHAEPARPAERRGEDRRAGGRQGRAEEGGGEEGGCGNGPRGRRRPRAAHRRAAGGRRQLRAPHVGRHPPLLRPRQHAPAAGRLRVRPRQAEGSGGLRRRRGL